MTRHFLVIGAQRCGTTWLHHQLEAHPQIAMARPTRPEPKVFLADLGPGQDHAWYVDTWFRDATPGQVLGEKSTSYVDRPDAIPRVRELLGDVPLVVQLRDPVARAVSHWRFSTESGLEERSLADALAANLDGPLPWDPSVDIGVAVRLSGARSLRHRAAAVAGRLRRAAPRAAPRGPAGGPVGHRRHPDPRRCGPRAGSGDEPRAGQHQPRARPRGRPRSVDRGRRTAEFRRERPGGLEALLGRSLPWVATPTPRRDEEPHR